MKVLVCGGREFTDEREVALRLAFLRRGDLLITGGARGADTLAALYAQSRGVDVQVVPAEWEKHGKRAGPIRNQAMLDMHPDLVVAFPGGVGTADMIRRATEAGVRVNAGC